MTPEAQTHQIDLSQEDSWDQIDDSQLTDNEKRVLSEQFREETDAIIYLTQSELADFKNIMQNETPEIVSSELQEFAAEQIKEWFSVSDTLWLSDELSDLVDWFEWTSQEFLFWPEGVFASHEISPNAKDHASAWLTLAILKVAENEEGNDIQQFTSAFWNIWESLQALNELSSETLPVMGSPLALHIEENGDKNNIFMNPEEGAKFYGELISWELSWRDAIKDRIEQENTSEQIELDISSIQDFIEDEAYFGGTIDTWDTTRPPIIPWAPETPWPDATEEEKNNYIDDLKEMGAIWKFFAAIFEFMNGIIWEKNGELEEEPNSEDEDPEGEETPEEIAPTLQEQARSTFREKLTAGAITSFDIEKILALFPEEGELTARAKQIINLIDSIPDYEWQADFESKFENLFLTETEAGNKKIDAFTTASGKRMFEEWASVGQNLANTLQSYIIYRQNWGGIHYTEYFQGLNGLDSGTTEPSWSN